MLCKFAAALFGCPVVRPVLPEPESLPLLLHDAINRAGAATRIAIHARCFLDVR